MSRVISHVIGAELQQLTISASASSDACPLTNGKHCARPGCDLVGLHIEVLTGGGMGAILNIIGPDFRQRLNVVAQCFSS